MQVESGIEFGLLGNLGPLWSETADISLGDQFWICSESTYLTQSKRRSAGRLVSLWSSQYRCSLLVACLK